MQALHKQFTADFQPYIQNTYYILCLQSLYIKLHTLSTT